MFPALQTILSMTLGLGLLALTTVCVVLWRRVRDLSKIVRRSAARPGLAEPLTIPIDPPLPVPPAPRIVAPTGPRPAATAPVVRFDRAEMAGPTLIVVPNLATTPAPAPGTSAEMDRRFGDVWALADLGEPVGTIAGRTGYPIGQIELILGLRRRLPATAEAGSDG